VHQQHEQRLARGGARLGRAPTLLGGAGHVRPAVRISRQPTSAGSPHAPASAGQATSQSCRS
jgi:hypothetical protein